MSSVSGEGMLLPTFHGSGLNTMNSETPPESASPRNILINCRLVRNETPRPSEPESHHHKTLGGTLIHHQA